MKLFSYLLLCLTFVASCSYASESSTLSLTLINHSHEKLLFTGVTHKNPGTTFAVTPNSIAPGETVVMTGTTTKTQDLIGTLHFKDDSGNDNPFLIIDYRKFKVGQPVFNFSHNKKFSSSLLSRTLNPINDGRVLAYSAATVEIESLQK